MVQMYKKTLKSILPILAVSLLTLQGCLSSPTVVGIALPALIKVDEGKLKRKPDNAALALAAGSYNIMYANAFVQGPAQMLPASRYKKRDAAFVRAKKIYMRGVNILRDSLNKKYPGINDASQGQSKTYLAALNAADVPLIYWLVAGTLAAYSIDPFDLELGFKIPELSALIKRAYELDPNYNNGALDEFFILFYGALPPALGGNIDLAKKHYALAIEKTNGESASPYVSYAESIAIPSQDYDAFKTNLDAALAVDIGKVKGATNKLAQKLSKRRARYLLKNAGNYFLLDLNN
jgi:predicted anti-sigma-YlaC factor YlaD